MNFIDTPAMPQAISAKVKPQRRDTLRYVFRLLKRFLAGPASRLFPGVHHVDCRSGDLDF